MSTIIFAVIVYIFSAERLIIRSEVNWEEIERVLKLSDISYLKLTLSDGVHCNNVKFSSDKIDMDNVTLYPGDVTRLQQFLSNSQHQSWSVRMYLDLTNLESESDWEGLAELLQSLHSVFIVSIPSNCQLSTNTLRQLWDKASDGWDVNDEYYSKSNVSDFDIIVNKHFK